MLNLIAVGRLKEPYYRSAAAEYEKRLQSYGGIRIVELQEVRLPEHPSQAQIAAALEKEAGQIRSRIPKNSWLCVLTPEGTMLSSEKLAERLQSVRLGGRSELIFVIGSSYGLAPALKAQADFCLSMSSMTFPHHLARVMILEQLYRAESLLSGAKYHK